MTKANQSTLSKYLKYDDKKKRFVASRPIIYPIACLLRRSNEKRIALYEMAKSLSTCVIGIAEGRKGTVGWKLNQKGELKLL